MKSTTEATLVTVFMSQQTAKSEEEAKRIARAATLVADCIGAKIFPPPRSGPKRWIVQIYHRDDGGRLPSGMARLTVAADALSRPS